MVKLNRLLENRHYSKSNYYLTFKKKVTMAFELQRGVEENKFSKESVMQSRRQYIVYLVSCLESYLEEYFKNSIDTKQVDFDKLSKIKWLRNLKLNSLDLLNMEKEKIKISEIIVEHLNFQNVNCIFDLCHAIEFNKYTTELKKSLKEKNSKKECPIITDFMKTVSKQKNKTLDNLKVSKATCKLFIEEMASANMLLQFFNADKCIGTISLLIQKRHKIVHKAADIKVENWEVLAYTLAVVQFSSILFTMHNNRLK